MVNIRKYITGGPKNHKIKSWYRIEQGPGGKDLVSFGANRL